MLEGLNWDHLDWIAGRISTKNVADVVKIDRANMNKEQKSGKSKERKSNVEKSRDFVGSGSVCQIGREASANGESSED